MKIAVGILLLALIGLSIRLELKNADLKRQVTAVTDTLASQRVQQKVMSEEAARHFFNVTGEWSLRKKPGVIEVHRLVANFDKGFFMLQCELGKDGSVKAVLKKAKIEDPLFQNPEEITFTHDSLVCEIKAVDFQSFKDKLAELEFPAATIENDIMCCFGGGTLDWKAILADDQRHHFSTFCRQSVRFAEACEFLLRKTNDADLIKLLHHD